MNIHLKPAGQVGRAPPGPLRGAWDEFAGPARQNLPMARRLLPAIHMLK